MFRLKKKRMEVWVQFVGVKGWVFSGEYETEADGPTTRWAIMRDMEKSGSSVSAVKVIPVRHQLPSRQFGRTLF